jgi:hypothetical protein
MIVRRRPHRPDEAGMTKWPEELSLCPWSKHVVARSSGEEKGRGISARHVGLATLVTGASLAAWGTYWFRSSYTTHESTIVQVLNRHGSHLMNTLPGGHVQLFCAENR